jgi:type I restriction enzyme S subunit
MAAERRYIPASEFCSSVRDGTHDSPKPVDKGRKLVTSRHLTTGRLDLSDAYLISEEDFEAINKRSKVDRWDVLISMIGTVGEPCLIKEEPDFAIKNIGLFKTQSEADGKWLYYFLRSKEAQQSIREQSRGTTQQYIPLGALRDFPILVCDDPEEQKAIIEVLGALDDKIELNRRMNATLEATARALFQSWFVDFDPVRAKLDGRTPSGIDPATAALFPDSFEESPLGHIPKGWEVKTLGDVIELAYGKPLKAEDRKNGHVCVYGSNGPVGCHNEKLVSGPGIIVGRKGNPGVVTWAHGDFYPIDTTFYVDPIGACSSLYYLFFALSNHDLANLSADSAVPGLNRNHAYMSKQVIPPALLLEAFDKQAAPIFAVIHATEIQSLTLATLRDILLSKLLSRELSVAEITKEASV